jgi:chromosome segregation ATPase
MSTEQTIADLETKLAATEQAIATNEESRAQLAYAAHADDDKKARKALADLGDQALKLQHEREDLTHALAEARRRHGAAVADDARAAEREAAAQVDHLFEQLVVCYRAADSALAAYALALNDAAEIHRAIRKLGCGHVSPRAPDDIERRALSTVIQEAALWCNRFDHRALEHAAKVPSLALIAEAWHHAVRQAPNGWVAQRLGETVAEAAE